jgi:hypothetical protein
VTLRVYSMRLRRLPPVAHLFSIRRKRGTQCVTAKNANHANGSGTVSPKIPRISRVSRLPVDCFGVGCAMDLHSIKVYNQRVQATPEGALGESMLAWPGAPDPGRSTGGKHALSPITI